MKNFKANLSYWWWCKSREIGTYLITLILDRFENPERCIDPYMEKKGRIGLFWWIDDVDHVLSEMENPPELDFDDKVNILLASKENHDAESGVCWASIEAEIENYAETL